MNLYSILKIKLSILVQHETVVQLTDPVCECNLKSFKQSAVIFPADD